MKTAIISNLLIGNGLVASGLTFGLINVAFALLLTVAHVVAVVVDTRRNA